MFVISKITSAVLAAAFAIVGGEPDTLQIMESQTFVKNGMEVTVERTSTHLNVSMEAPTEGWVAIGFNPKSGLAGTYLLMGRVVKGKAEVVEHYTQRPGVYPAITSLGGKVQVQQVSGTEKAGRTHIEFSLPLTAIDSYRYSFSKGLEFTMLMAFSTHDDFDHHSRMRTETAIQIQ